MQGKKKISLLAKILIGVAGVILATFLGILLYANLLYSRMNVETKDDIVLQEETFEKDADTGKLDEVNAEDVEWNDTGSVSESDEVVNILLAGVEAMHDDSGRGRTDSIMIASLCKGDKAFRLTSIMRDTYVQIPGYSDNKINAAYSIGGMPLLVETVEENFDIKLDGYVTVGFDGFEAIIDYLGGINLTISSQEAQYLNTTDYIDNYWNQNLSAGTITMNGDQALGYARVRYVNNGNLSGDFGRTKRHRNIITAIFDKFKGKSLVDMMTELPELMQYVTTDLTRTQCISFLTDFVEISPKCIDNFRIPIDDAYNMTRVNGMSVILPDDLRTNIVALRQFIYGKKYVDKGRHDPHMMNQ